MDLFGAQRGLRQQAFAQVGQVSVGVSRGGDTLVHPGNEPHVSQDVSAMIVWMDDAAPLVPGKEYLLKHGPHKTPASVVRIAHRVDVNTLERSPAPALALNDIGEVAIRTSRPLVYDAYAKNRATGAFILIDRLTNMTAGAGMLLDAMMREFASRARSGSDQTTGGAHD
jgi:bifunctional enzyme CysN/CysC